MYSHNTRRILRWSSSLFVTMYDNDLNRQSPAAPTFTRFVGTLILKSGVRKESGSPLQAYPRSTSGETSQPSRPAHNFLVSRGGETKKVDGINCIVSDVPHLSWAGLSPDSVVPVFSTDEAIANRTGGLHGSIGSGFTGCAIDAKKMFSANINSFRDI